MKHFRVTVDYGIHAAESADDMVEQVACWLGWARTDGITVREVEPDADPTTVGGISTPIVAASPGGLP